MLGDRRGINRRQFVRVNNELCVTVVLVPDFDSVAAEVQLGIEINDAELVAVVHRGSHVSQWARIVQSEFIDNVAAGEGDDGPARVLCQQYP